LGQVLIAQADDGMSTVDEIFMKPFPSLIPSDSFGLHRVCDGDECKDVYSLLHRNQQTTIMNVANNSWFKVVDEGTVESSYNLFRLWFLFNKGKKNYKIIQLPSALANPINGILYAFGGVFDGGSFFTAQGRNFPGRMALAIESWTYKPSMEVDLPFYSRYPFYTNEQTSMQPGADDSRMNYLALLWNGTTTSTDQPQFKIFMSLADDWSFGWARGAPTLITQ